MNDISCSSKPHTPEKLKERYEKLLKQLEKDEERKKVQFEKQVQKNLEKEIDVDELWAEVKNFVYERDNQKCQLVKLLQDGNIFDMLTELREEAGSMIRIIDPAHIFPRSTHPQLKYDPDNIVSLNRFSHFMLDTFRDPISGKDNISNEDRLSYFETIIGKDRMDLLKSKL